MRAAVVRQPGDLQVQSVPDPEVGDYDALCEILYGATCTATDQHIINGRMMFDIPYPTILGHESIGRVIEVGKRVRSFRKGDLVTRVGAPPSEKDGIASHWGGFAELGIARDHWVMKEDQRPREEWDKARRNQVLPPDTKPAAATMMITWRETLSYLTRMGVGEGSDVLIIGSGANGLAFANHARNLRAATIALVGNRTRAEVAKQVGAEYFVDYTTVDPAASLREAVPRGFEIIVDAVGKRDSITPFLSLLQPNGAFGIYGIEDYGRWAISPTELQGTFTCYQGLYDEEEAHEQVLCHMQRGELDASHWLELDSPWPLDSIVQAFENVRARRLIKALIRVSPRAPDRILETNPPNDGTDEA